MASRWQLAVGIYRYRSFEAFPSQATSNRQMSQSPEPHAGCCAVPFYQLPLAFRNSQLIEHNYSYLGGPSIGKTQPAHLLERNTFGRWRVLVLRKMLPPSSKRKQGDAGNVHKSMNYLQLCDFYSFRARYSSNGGSFCEPGAPIPERLPTFAALSSLR